MFPQVIDARKGMFRQYQINGVMTIGLDQDAVHACVLVVNPSHQYRIFQFFVNGHQVPDSQGYLLAPGEPVQTPLSLSSKMTVGLNEPFMESPHGLIIVHLYKGQEQLDGPTPLMGANAADNRGLTLHSANQAAIEPNTPDYLELVARYHIRLARWSELKEVAEPILSREGWGPPITEEDRAVSQFWSRQHVW